MYPKIALITIFTDNIAAMVLFYRDVLGFQPQEEVDENHPGYTEFKHEGVHFAICPRPVMYDMLGLEAYKAAASGQSFELAFSFDTPAAVDAAYADIVSRGAAPIRASATMPWNQHTAFFADPDGNIHELFANL